MKWNRLLYFDVETTSLDPEVASIREMAFVKEVDGMQVGDVVNLKVKPILHFEDQLYGGERLADFCGEFNSKYRDGDPKRLVPFAFSEGDPLFMYAKELLTFNLPAPQKADPGAWLLGKESMSAKKALMTLIEYLSEPSGIDGITKWVLVGHNIGFDLDVLTWWSRRILGTHEAEKQILSKINKWVTLDTLPLVRWFQWSGRIRSQTARLGDAADALGINTDGLHTAAGDIRMTQEIIMKLLKPEYDFEIPF